MESNGEPKGICIIVLGKNLINNEAQPELVRRLQKAKERGDAEMRSLGPKKAPIFIVCGGICQGNTVTEASVMKRILINFGVPANLIIEEGWSQSTVENMLFCKFLIPKQIKYIALVTSDYHMNRAVRLFREHSGYTGLLDTCEAVWFENFSPATRAKILAKEAQPIPPKRTWVAYFEYKGVDHIFCRFISRRFRLDDFNEYCEKMGKFQSENLEDPSIYSLISSFSPENDLHWKDFYSFTETLDTKIVINIKMENNLEY